MMFSIDPLMFFLMVVLSADALAVLFLFFGMLRRCLAGSIRLRSRELVLNVVSPEPEHAGHPRPDLGFIKRWKWIFLEECGRIADSVALTENQRLSLSNLFVRSGLDIKLFRGLRSPNCFFRTRAALGLSLFPARKVLLPLVNALENERSHAGKLFIASSLADLGEAAAIPTIIDTLKGSPGRYQRAACGILSEFGGEIDEYIPLLIPRRQKEIKMLLIHLANRHCSPLLRRHIEKLTRSEDLDISHAAFRVLSSVHADSLDHKRYLVHEDFLIRNLATESLGRIPRTGSLALLFDHLDDPVIRKSACLAITALIRARPHFLKIVMQRCLNERRPNARRVLADVLANYVDYLMGKTLREESAIVEQIIFELVKYGKTSEIINFLNRNANAEIEREITTILKKILAEKPAVAGEFLKYLNHRIIGDLGLEKQVQEKTHSGRSERHNQALLVFFLFLGAVFVPVICLVFAAFYTDTSDGFLRLAAFCFNSVFAVYAFALSAIYLALLVFSVRGVRKQSRIGDMARNSVLFKENVLPSISIISPAYNEEATIVESVNSLFNLQYPDYEIIVVNDGSTDQTLERLISAFELERTDVFIHAYLQTREIKAVYANKRFPELLVIDKMNGGKADSLNAGINVGGKEYFSGIDSDSLLERDALLNLASLFLFSENEVTAAGGNIFPVNGCTVHKGALASIRIPRGHLARFQTVEYIRAFMAGRVGWSELKLLLIISGAFGVFHRRTVINAGGYLTQSGRFQKDTVGEDMELVVRLCRRMRESKTPFSMVYGYNANCWTEIPERVPILVNQRDRWQRGLLDIITFHWRLLWNPSYGRIGLVGFPYFLIFEVLGPWLELEGFLVFFASLAAGWISLPIFALFFAITAGLGFVTSVISISIAEYKKEYFPLRDKLKLMAYALLENLGIRQLLNLIRVRGFARMLAKTQGWGRMDRRGFNSDEKKA